MLRITATDGAVFIGPDYRQIADAMHQDEWHPSKQLEDWMARAADRVGQIHWGAGPVRRTRGVPSGSPAPQLGHDRPSSRLNHTGVEVCM